MKTASSVLSVVVLVVAVARAQPSAQPSPHGANPHQGHAGPAQQPVVASQASDEVAVGTIVVRVVDPSGTPIPDADVRLGVLVQGGDRDSQRGSTDAEGIATFADLATGSSQAYRVTVPYEGATYGSMPFRLSDEHGHRVVVRRLPVTRVTRSLLQVFGRTIVEIKNERLHVVQQVRLQNVGDATIVLPPEGVQIALPDDQLAFQTQASMADHRVQEEQGSVVVRGSFPPGPADLVWAYDVPTTGSREELVVQNPFSTINYQVIVQAPAGLQVDVDGMPRAAKTEDGNGSPVWLSEVQRRPGDEPLDEITLHLSGIPGPGPVRWVAVTIAFALVVLGFALRTVWRSYRAEPVRLQAMHAELLEQARRLKAEVASGGVGPEYEAKRHAELRNALALVLREQSKT